MIKEYFKYLHKGLLNGGYIITGAILFCILPFIVLEVFERHYFAFTWIIVSSLITLHFGNFYCEYITRVENEKEEKL